MPLPFIHQDIAVFFFSSESLKKSFKNLINSRRLESLAIGETLLVSMMSCDLGSGQIWDFIHLCLTCSRPLSPSLSWVPTVLQTGPVGSPRPVPDTSRVLRAALLNSSRSSTRPPSGPCFWRPVRLRVTTLALVVETIVKLKEMIEFSPPASQPLGNSRGL